MNPKISYLKKTILCILPLIAYPAFSSIQFSCGDLQKKLWQSHDFKVSNVNYNDGSVYGHNIKEWAATDLNSIIKQFDDCISIYDKKQTSTHKLISKRKNFLEQMKDINEKIIQNTVLMELKYQLKHKTSEYEKNRTEMNKLEGSLAKEASSEENSILINRKKYRGFVSKHNKIMMSLTAIDKQLDNIAKLIQVKKRYLFLDKKLIAKLTKALDSQQSVSNKHQELKESFDYGVIEIQKIVTSISQLLDSPDLATKKDVEWKVKPKYVSITYKWDRLQANFSAIKNASYEFSKDEYGNIQSSYLTSGKLVETAITSYQDKLQELETIKIAKTKKQKEIKANTERYIKILSNKSSLVTTLLANGYLDSFLTISSQHNAFYTSSNSVFSCLEESLKTYDFKLHDSENILTISFGSKTLFSFEEIISFYFAYVDERFTLVGFSDSRIKGELSGTRKIGEVLGYIDKCEQKYSISLTASEI